MSKLIFQDLTPFTARAPRSRARCACLNDSRRVGQQAGEGKSRTYNRLVPIPSRLAVAPALALVLAVAAGPRSALAWGPEAHRIAGDIAQRLLTERAAREVAGLLRYDRLADRRPSGRSTLGEIANWADEIRSEPWSRKYSRWHYDDIPLCGTAPQAKICPRGNCASARLEQQLGILKDRGKRWRERNEALKWVVHLVADIHQPLHAADNGDRGGNRIVVTFFGAGAGRWGSLNLHAIWDEQLVERLLAARGGEAAIAAAPIAQAERSAWEKGSVRDWTAESNALARSAAYGNIPGFRCGAAVTQPVAIADAYYSAVAPHLERQFRKAGVRLAKLVNEALDSR